MARFLWLLFFGVLALMTGPAADVEAAVVRGLYTAEVQVDDQSDQARTRGFEQALREVFVKVTGDSDLQTERDIGAILRKAPRYVRQFSYFTRVSGDPPAEQEEQWLRVNFDPVNVERLIRESGLPVWGKERPSTLLWLAVQSGRERSVLGGDSNPGVLALVERAAERRGIPVLLPLMDLEDRSRITFADFLGGFEENILLASQRYGADAVLIGSLAQRPSGSWRGRFTLRSEGLWETRELNAGSVGALIESGIDFTAEELARQYSFSAQTLGETLVELQVAGIAALGDYARVLAYLSDLSPVSSVQVKRLSTEGVRYVLAVRGGRSDLQKVIALGNVLEQEAMPPWDPQTAQENGALALQYRLRP